jgi:hypothetical protein
MCCIRSPRSSLSIDLDDGVLVKLSEAWECFEEFGLEKDRKKVEGWDWPMNKLEPVDA